LGKDEFNVKIRRWGNEEMCKCANEKMCKLGNEKMLARLLAGANE
jgi:hypothetical protein